VKKTDGKIIIPPGANVWPHELRTAHALAAAGHTIRFFLRSDREFETSADAYVDGLKYEFKSPRASSIKAVERNLKRGRWQSENIVFDSRRMKHIPDQDIQRELTRCASIIGGLERIKFIDRHGAVIDIG
jgi:hypothetical protein